MTIDLRADTAKQILVGPAVAVGDGFVPVTNLVGASADEYELIKDNGATAMTAAPPTNAVSTGITNADGYYNLLLPTGDVDTEGQLTLLIHDDDLILPLRHDYNVMSQNAYDSKYGADRLEVNVMELNSIAQSLLDLADFADEGYNPATNKITGLLLADAVAAAGINNAAFAADVGSTAFATNIIALACNKMLDDAMVETTGAPPITGTFRAFFEWLFALSRNEIVQTAGQSALRNDADTTDLSTSAVSDASSIYNRGKWSA